jgi:endonuclease G
MKRYAQKQAAGNARSFIIIAALFGLVVYMVAKYIRHQEPARTPTTQDQKAPLPAGPLSRLEMPALRPGERPIAHKGYTLCYNEQHEQAAWVAYTLRKKGGPNAPNYARTDKFLEDPMVATGSAGNADYEGSGYDRGHLAPAEDMDWSRVTMAESFYYSNMSPQVPAFNRGVWRRLEELVRFWAGEFDSLYIVTVLTNGLPTIGHNKVSVPAYYFKAVLRYNGNEAKGIGFVLANEASAATLKSFAVPIDSVEKLAGIDLFPQLPDNMENRVEAGPDIDDWPWTRKRKQK